MTHLGEVHKNQIRAIEPEAFDNATCNSSGSEQGRQIQEVDENGDYVFHFKLNLDHGSIYSLEVFYQESIRDLLQLVRFYADGKPVIVDSFSFLNSPEKRIEILENKRS